MIGRACCRCRQLTDPAAMVLVGVPFANSGPGGPAFYACLPCARVYAASPLAPEWLADDAPRATRASRSSRRYPASGFGDVPDPEGISDGR